MTGGADFETPPEFSGAAPDQRARASITLPDRLALGAAWRRGPWRALADVEVTLWGTYDQLTIDFADAATRDVHQQNAWHTTTAVRAGGEYALGATTTLRVGAAIDPSPAPAGTLSPVAPDGLRWSLTAGGSARVARGVMVDGFAEYLRVAARTTTSVETMPARYQGWAVLFGAGVRWGAR